MVTGMVTKKNLLLNKMKFDHDGSEMFLFYFFPLKLKKAERMKMLNDHICDTSYGWMLLIFLITCTFSMIAPVITVFNFMYLVLKHYVDRHNLYFVYKPSKVS